MIKLDTLLLLSRTLRTRLTTSFGLPDGRPRIVLFPLLQQPLILRPLLALLSFIPLASLFLGRFGDFLLLLSEALLDAWRRLSPALVDLDQGAT